MSFPHACHSESGERESRLQNFMMEQEQKINEVLSHGVAEQEPEFRKT
jgi:hypothetical protein